MTSILEDDSESVENRVNSDKFDPKEQDPERQTPLHYAAFIGNPVSHFLNKEKTLLRLKFSNEISIIKEICLSLIRNGAQIDTKDQDGLTPLHRACGADRNEGTD